MLDTFRALYADLVNDRLNKSTDFDTQVRERDEEITHTTTKKYSYPTMPCINIVCKLQILLQIGDCLCLYIPCMAHQVTLYTIHISSLLILHLQVVHMHAHIVLL